MTDAVDENGDLLPDKERLPRFGQMLRSTSLDELPEFRRDSLEVFASAVRGRKRHNFKSKRNSHLPLQHYAYSKYEPLQMRLFR